MKTRALLMVWFGIATLACGGGGTPEVVSVPCPVEDGLLWGLHEEEVCVAAPALGEVVHAAHPDAGLPLGAPATVLEVLHNVRASGVIGPRLRVRLDDREQEVFGPHFSSMTSFFPDDEEPFGIAFGPSGPTMFTGGRTPLPLEFLAAGTLRVSLERWSDGEPWIRVDTCADSDCRFAGIARGRTESDLRLLTPSGGSRGSLSLAVPDCNGSVKQGMAPLLLPTVEAITLPSLDPSAPFRCTDAGDLSTGRVVRCVGPSGSHDVLLGPGSADVLACSGDPPNDDLGWGLAFTDHTVRYRDDLRVR